MSDLSLLVSAHQLISFPAVHINGSRVYAHRFNDAYKLGLGLLSRRFPTNLYVVQISGTNLQLHYTVVTEDQIGEGRIYQLTDLVATVREQSVEEPDMASFYARYVWSFRVGRYQLTRNRLNGDWRLRNWARYSAHKIFTPDWPKEV